LEYEGAIYHVMSRGNRQEDIFLNDSDRLRLLETLGEACAKTGWQVHAYCLMRDHFHFVLETPRANLATGMHWLLGTYTVRFNRRRQVFGHLFSGRYKSIVVDGSGNGYLKTVCDYVHLNPVRAGLLEPGQPLQAYQWSSYPGYLQPPEERPAWLRVDRLLGEWGVQRDNDSGQRRFAQGMEERRSQEQAKENGDWARLRRGWFWGPKAFREELLEKIQKNKGSERNGEELRESDEQRARRLIQRMLAEAGWEASALGATAKGDPVKAGIAARLREKTTMPWGWIAKELGMGHWRTAANAVRVLKSTTSF
jgi:REP element-mobilizing transposase RayT